VGIRCADHVTPSTRKSRYYCADSGGLSVGIDRLRTKATEFSLVCSLLSRTPFPYRLFSSMLSSIIFFSLLLVSILFHFYINIPSLVTPSLLIILHPFTYSFLSFFLPLSFPTFSSSLLVQRHDSHRSVFTVWKSSNEPP
jgi:hypothetical protein